MKKLAIAYRIYPGVSKSPAVFSDNKYSLSELCLKSFAEAIKNIDTKIWVILDNCPAEYHQLFRNYLGPSVEFIDTPGIGNGKTFVKQMDILLSQNFSENVFFAEDDYFYLPNAFDDLLEFADSSTHPDFLTPYDHKDYYDVDLHNYRKTTLPFSDKINWTTESATCLTFFTTKKTLRRTYPIFKTYMYRNFDISIWLAMTKKRVFNPTIYPKYLFNDFPMFKVLAKAWLYTPLRLPFGKQYSLYAPQPSLATHMESLFLAPNVDWYELFEKAKKDLPDRK